MRREWTALELENAAIRRREGQSFDEIGRATGRTAESVRTALRDRRLGKVLGSEAKPHPMREAAETADAIVRKYGKAVDGTEPYAGAAKVAEPNTVMGKVKRTWTVLGPSAPGRYRVAHVGDIHFGSKHCDAAALLDFLRIAADRGCTAYVQTGDVCDGVKSVLAQEQRAVGYDDQHAEAVDVISKAPRLPWVVIDGNHDGYSNDAVGMESGIVLAKRMHEAGIDWRYMGSCLGRAVIHGARWELFHPHGAGSTPNSIRTTLNKKAEKYVAGDEPHVLAIGHFHKMARIHTDPENVFCIAAGAFQTQMRGSDFAKRMVNPWDIGSSIVSWTVFPDGKVGEFSVEFIRVRDHALGWEAA